MSQIQKCWQLASVHCRPQRKTAVSSLPPNANLPQAIGDYSDIVSPRVSSKDPANPLDIDGSYLDFFDSIANSDRTKSSGFDVFDQGNFLRGDAPSDLNDSQEFVHDNSMATSASVAHHIMDDFLSDGDAGSPIIASGLLHDNLSTTTGWPLQDAYNMGFSSETAPQLVNGQSNLFGTQNDRETVKRATPASLFLDAAAAREVGTDYFPLTSDSGCQQLSEHTNSLGIKNRPNTVPELDQTKLDQETSTKSVTSGMCWEAITSLSSQNHAILTPLFSDQNDSSAQTRSHLAHALSVLIENLRCSSREKKFITDALKRWSISTISSLSSSISSRLSLISARTTKSSKDQWVYAFHVRTIKEKTFRSYGTTRRLY